jgi:hypothetical protein
VTCSTTERKRENEKDVKETLDLKAADNQLVITYLKFLVHWLHEQASSFR